MNLQTLGTVQLKISFRNETFIHNFYILPKSYMSMIVGRDLLSEFNITLARFRKHYSKLMLMNLNKDKILNLKNRVFIISSKRWVFYVVRSRLPYQRYTKIRNCPIPIFLQNSFLYQTNLNINNSMTQLFLKCVL